MTTAIGTRLDQATAVARQPNGRLVVAGYSDGYGFAVARYLPSGVLDASFGRGGIVRTAEDGGARALVIQPDGKIVVAGDGFDVFAVVRYMPDGRLDKSFGRGGRATTSFADTASAFALIRQPDGKLVVAGAQMRVLKGDTFALARYNVDGSSDSTFGHGGKVTTPFGEYGADAHALVRQPDGKLVAAGDSKAGFTLVRYLADGRIDPSFGRSGTATTRAGSGGGPDHLYALLIEPDGKLVASGYGYPAPKASYTAFALARFTSDGSRDESFGHGGTVMRAIGTGNAVSRSLVREPDGKLVAAGYSSPSSRALFTLVRFDEDGTVDAGFGQGGIATTAPDDRRAYINALIRQPDGKLIAVGHSAARHNNRAVFTLARYTGQGALDRTFGRHVGATQTTRAGTPTRSKLQSLLFRAGDLPVGFTPGRLILQPRFKSLPPPTVSAGRTITRRGVGGDVWVFVYANATTEALAFRRILGTLGRPLSPYAALNPTARYAAYSIAGGAIQEVLLGLEECKALIRIELTGTSKASYAGNYAARLSARLKPLVC